MTRAADVVLDEARIWSASLPAVFGYPARPWNGRELTPEECARARAAAMQAAFEWLSEHA